MLEMPPALPIVVVAVVVVLVVFAHVTDAALSPRAASFLSLCFSLKLSPALLLIDLLHLNFRLVIVYCTRRGPLYFGHAPNTHARCHCHCH